MAYIPQDDDQNPLAELDKQMGGYLGPDTTQDPTAQARLSAGPVAGGTRAALPVDTELREPVDPATGKGVPAEVLGQKFAPSEPASSSTTSTGYSDTPGSRAAIGFAEQFADRQPGIQFERVPDKYAGVRDEMVKRLSADDEPLDLGSPETHSSSIPDHNWAAELHAARADSRRQGGMAAIVGAAEGLNEALNPIKAAKDQTLGWGAKANRPMEQFQDSMTLDKLAREQLAAKEAQDPASKTNRTAQNILMATFPALAKRLGPDRVRMMTKAQIDDLMGAGKMRSDEQSKKDASLSGILNQDRQDNQVENQFRYNMAKDNTANRREYFKDALSAEKTESGKQDTINSINFRKALDENSKTQDAIKDLLPAELQQNFEDLERIAPGITSNSADMNSAGVPTWLDKTAAKISMGLLPVVAKIEGGDAEKRAEFLQDLSHTLSALRKPIAGVAVNPTEAKEWDRILGVDPVQSPAAAMAAISLAKKRLQKEVETRQAPHVANIKLLGHPEVIEEAKANHALYPSAFDFPAGPKAAGAPKAPVPVQAPQAPAPSRPAAATPASPDDTVRVVAPDGSPGRIPRSKVQAAIAKGFKVVE